MCEKGELIRSVTKVMNENVKLEVLTFEGCCRGFQVGKDVQCPRVQYVPQERQPFAKGAIQYSQKNAKERCPTRVVLTAHVDTVSLCAAREGGVGEPVS